MSNRVVVLVLLVAALAAGVALERRTPDVTSTRVTTAAADGPVVPPADALSTGWYCAAGTATAEGLGQETIHVANLSAREVTATVTVEPGTAAEEGTAGARELDLEPFERATVAVDEILADASPGVIVEVAGGPAIVEHEIRAGGDVAMSACAAEPSPEWYFASGSTARGSLQLLELFNPFGDDAIVDIAFLTDGSVQEPQALQGFVVGRRSKVQVAVHELVARQEQVATRIRARTGRVVAEQVRAFDPAEAGAGVGVAMALGSTEPQPSWTLPVTIAETGAGGAVAIANFGLAPASVEVSVLLDGEGVLAPETIDVSSRSAVTFDPSGRVPAGDAYTVVVRSRGGAPVVAESWVAAPTGTATALGAAAPARRWALAGAPADASSAVLAVNTGNAPVTVELRAHTAGDPDSPRSAPAIALAPGRVGRFDLDEWGIEPDQVLVVSANGPIVVGRATYAGGTSVALAVPFGG